MSKYSLHKMQKNFAISYQPSAVSLGSIELIADG